MLPRELIEELIGGLASTSLHVVVALPDAFDGLLRVLALPFEVVGEDVVKSVSSALAAAPSKILELRQSLGFYGHRFQCLDCESIP